MPPSHACYYISCNFQKSEEQYFTSFEAHLAEGSQVELWANYLPPPHPALRLYGCNPSILPPTCGLSLPLLVCKPSQAGLSGFIYNTSTMAPSLSCAKLKSSRSSTFRFWRPPAAGRCYYICTDDATYHSGVIELLHCPHWFVKIPAIKWKTLTNGAPVSALLKKMF